MHETLSFENQKTYTISIDPNLPESYALLANLRQDFDSDPSITGLALVLEEEIGESSSFWEKIKSLLEKSLTGLTLNQFRVAIKSMDEAQDLTPIFAMPFFKDVQRLCIDGTLYSFSYQNQIFTVKASRAHHLRFKHQKCNPAYPNIIKQFS